MTKLRTMSSANLTPRHFLSPKRKGENENSFLGLPEGVR